jgi:hypothetical protein
MDLISRLWLNHTSRFGRARAFRQNHEEASMGEMAMKQLSKNRERLWITCMA